MELGVFSNLFNIELRSHLEDHPRIHPSEDVFPLKNGGFFHSYMLVTMGDRFLAPNGIGLFPDPFQMGELHGF